MATATATATALAPRPSTSPNAVPSSGLLLFGGGIVATLAAFLPWASMSMLSVSGVSAGWGVLTAAAGVAATTAGLVQLRNGTGANALIRLLLAIALLSGVAALAIPYAVAAELHEPIVRRQLDAHLAPHGLEADDLLGGDAQPSLFQQWAPMLSGDVADVVEAVESTMEIRLGRGLWLTLGAGAVIAAGAALGLIRSATRVPAPALRATASMCRTAHLRHLQDTP